MNERLLSDLAEHITISMHHCSLSEHPGGWQEEKSHPDYDLWLFTEGSAETDIAGHSAILREGDVFLMPPRVRYRAQALSPVAFLCFHFDCSLGVSRRFISDLDIAGAIAGDTLGDETRILRRAYDDMKASRPLGAFTLRSAVSLIFARIAAMKLSSRSETSLTVEGRALEKIKPALDHIASHMDAQISTEMLASAAGMTVKYFSTYFRKHIGLTPRRYIEQLKMNRAREHLSERVHSVGEIASLIGFSDQFTFSKAFKKCYRISPSGYMKEIAGKG